MVNYDIQRGVKVVTSSDSDRTESKLTFANASKRDEGNYTCSPSNSAPATVQLFVTRSKYGYSDIMRQHQKKSVSNFMFFLFRTLGIINFHKKAKQTQKNEEKWTRRGKIVQILTSNISI